MDVTVIDKICDFSETITQIKAVLVKSYRLIFLLFCCSLTNLIHKVTMPPFPPRNESALSRQQHTYWRTWSPSLLTLFGWLPEVNTELELTPMKSLQKLHRHVGLLPYLTELKLSGKEHIFKCIQSFMWAAKKKIKKKSEDVTKMSERSFWAQINQIRFFLPLNVWCIWK